MKTKSILLIGLGRFGKYIAIKLNELGHEIMAIDENEERINDAMPYVTNGLIGDSTNEALLKSLGVKNYDVCIVTIGGNFQSSLETTCLLKELGAQKVVARAEQDVQAKFLLRNGADEIIYPEKQLAIWAAIRYSSDHILDYIELGDSCMDRKNCLGNRYSQKIQCKYYRHKEKRKNQCRGNCRHDSFRRRNAFSPWRI